KRPRDIKEQTIIERTKPCPFCPDRLDKNNVLDEISARGESASGKNKGKNWQVISLSNIYPAVTLNNERAYGTQEVIIETPDHVKELAELPEDQIELVLRMYARRTKAIAENKKIDYILCFKNQGSKSGATIVHAHSQIFATQILPPDVHAEMGLAQNYTVKHGVCPYCDIIKKEMKSQRKIFEDKFVAAFAPYASEYHYEAWIFPKRHLDNINRLNKDEFKSFAKALKKILLKLHALDLSFNFFLHNVVSNKNQHFYLKIQPRDSIWAGVELGSGLVINSISPEAAAKYYRE
ncbi:DUF4931 domain-containing protein, partial [Candidatus Parcubacteria bacterium]|nr:DUF4931 domain-containing protein [Candidatus Parcubacteria bacterium]